jgi:hypothetical protein
VDRAERPATAHTPGPWNLDDRVLDEFASEDHHGFRVIYAGGRDIAYCLVTSENPDTPSEEDQDVCEANARLIAAAPELLEACEFLVQCLRDWMETDPEGERADDLGILNKGLAAVAKAKGKQRDASPQNA